MVVSKLNESLVEGNKMEKKNILAIGYGGTTHLMALCAREKVADDMYKSANSEKEKEFYKHELENIRAVIGNMTVCS